MKQRRSLGAALVMSDEKVAFIQGEMTAVNPLMTSPTEPETVVQVRQSQEEAKPIGNQKKQAIVKNQKRTTVQSPRGVQVKDLRRERANAVEEIPGIANLLVPLTTRLSPTTATALKRAGLEQRLYGRRPSTVQEIAEEAIKGWLDSEGYL